MTPRRSSTRFSLGAAVVLCAACSGSASDGASAEDDGLTIDRRKHDAGHGDASTGDAGAGVLKTVFVVMMENHDWSSIKGNASAPYINGTLLPMGSHAEAYMNPPSMHPSEPNYIWLEAGSNLGVRDDASPQQNHQSTTSHLSSRRPPSTPSSWRRPTRCRWSSRKSSRRRMTRF